MHLPGPTCAIAAADGLVTGPSWPTARRWTIWTGRSTGYDARCATAGRAALGGPSGGADPGGVPAARRGRWVGVAAHAFVPAVADSRLGRRVRRDGARRAR